MPAPTNLTGSKFKNERGMLLTRSLFYETSLNADLAVYTLKDFDHTVGDKTYPSLYLLYMAANDPIEYTFANTHLDSWSHWEQLTESTFFKKTVARWRKELELKIRSEALAKIAQEAAKGGRDALRAHTYLLEKKWLEEPAKAPRGRPTKDDIKQAAIGEFEDESRITEDYKRLGIAN